MIISSHESYVKLEIHSAPSDCKSKSYLDLCKLDGFGAEAFALQMAPEAHLEYHPIASYH